MMGLINRSSQVYPVLDPEKEFFKVIKKALEKHDSRWLFYRLVPDNIEYSPDFDQVCTNYIELVDQLLARGFNFYTDKKVRSKVNLFSMTTVKLPYIHENNELVIPSSYKLAHEIYNRLILDYWVPILPLKPDSYSYDVWQDYELPDRENLRTRIKHISKIIQEPVSDEMLKWIWYSYKNYDPDITIYQALDYYIQYHDW